MPARRCISVSMSPSARASAAIWPAEPVGRAGACRGRHGRTRGRTGGCGCRRPACGNPGSGRRPTAAAPPRGRARRRADLRLARQRRQRFQVGWRRCPCTRPGPRRRRGQAVEQRIDVGEIQVAVAPAELRPAARSCGPRPRRRRRPAAAGSRAVVPNVPSRMPRPARPAIWATSAAVSRRGRWPSNLDRPAKATWSTSMFRPMPIASVATRKSTSFSWYSATWALRVRGLRAGPSPRRSRRGGGGSARRWRRPRRR